MRARASLASGIIAGSLLLALAAPASATETLSISDLTPGRGQLVTLTGSGCVPNSNVAAKIDGGTLKTGVADDEGDFLINVRIPFSTSLTFHFLGIRCPRGYPVGTTLVLKKQIKVHGGITVTPTTFPHRGQTVFVSGRGCKPFQNVDFKLGSRLLRTAPAGSTGAFSRGVTIPRTAPLGYNLLRAVCGSLDQSERVKILA